MLWLIIKVAVFIAMVGAAAFGASYLLDLDGGVRIVVAGVEMNLTPIKAVLALVALVLALWLLMRLAGLLVAVLRFINGDETALSRHFDRNRQEKGYRALGEAVLALAERDGDKAMAQAARAEKYLRKPALTDLITAQAAELAGDRAKAEAAFKRLLTNEKTRFVGVRGLLRQKLEAGDTDTALKLAKTAFALKPRHSEVQDMLLQLQADKGDWKGARATLGAKLKYGALPRDVHRRRDAVLALSEARDVLDEGKSIEAREAAIEANRLSPDLIPAAVLAARAYVEAGKPAKAERVITKAWLMRPHPDLAAAFAAIEPDETPQARLKRFSKLLKLHPDHRETRLLEAELHLAAEDFPAARRALGDLAEVEPDARALTIMAAIERGEGASDAVVKGWLARALGAPRGPQWCCDNCQHVHAEWQPVCESCHSFDTLSWRTPADGVVSTPTGLAMLPLLIGPPEEPAAGQGRAKDVPDGENTPGAEVVEAEDVSGTEAETEKADRPR
ncbi:MAG: tetratricopeptide repeat protein [Roseovarius sp.]|nr:tetratricopeptide repeat protein [Roseovarius sp.]